MTSRSTRSAGLLLTTIESLAAENENLPIHEDKARGVYVKNLSDFYVSNAGEVYEIMRQGGSARAVSATSKLTSSQSFPLRSANPTSDQFDSDSDMNAESSRSHSIFVISVQARNTETGTQKTGSLFLVDLAGSEKIGKTGATGQTLEEAKKINKSLSALGMVINALTDGKVCLFRKLRILYLLLALNLVFLFETYSPRISLIEILNSLVSYKNPSVVTLVRP